jgi:hypothetical protein
MTDDQELRKRFLKYATDYYAAAKYFQQSGQQSNQVVGHLNWTATELSLKALAVGHGMPSSDKPHDLDNVTKHLVDNGVIENSAYVGYLKPLYAHITGSATSYSEARYPTVDPTYWDSVTEQQMNQALHAGSKVQAFVKNKLRIEI